MNLPARIKHAAKSFRQPEPHHGHSPALLEIKQIISDYAASDLPILITGETGVGKELFAKAIHEMSPRKFHPYIKINCAAIPTELLESELFGYEPGAFSGASKNGNPVNSS